ncbi:hypothetical protein SAMN05216388_100977 [Halorientalis persicus]|uniref:Uncharacterized protein n=1 Tax=Halorientalis persicus TaxID=1367881 RepID=A0A1H8MPK1_9EURY|nr:hypothetical protein [Halorientalis persicus]SEO19315.1 hypothetical protein SAMN05216388_100977 [Halorientalis persicus]
MTIRKGEKKLVESVDQFQNYLNVSEEEICKSLPDDKQETLLEEYNQLAKNLKHEAEETPEADTVDDLPDWAFEEWYQLVEIGTNNLIINVLESRDEEYIHLYDGIIHTIVELHPMEE